MCPSLFQAAIGVHIVSHMCGSAISVDIDLKKATPYYFISTMNEAIVLVAAGPGSIPAPVGPLLHVFAPLYLPVSCLSPLSCKNKGIKSLKK